MSFSGYRDIFLSSGPCGPFHLRQFPSATNTSPSSPWGVHVRHQEAVPEEEGDEPILQKPRPILQGWGSLFHSAGREGVLRSLHLFACVCM